LDPITFSSFWMYFTEMEKKLNEKKHLIKENVW
jgi:hypothetical protein